MPSFRWIRYWPPYRPECKSFWQECLSLIVCISPLYIDVLTPSLRLWTFVICLTSVKMSRIEPVWFNTTDYYSSFVQHAYHQGIHHVGWYKSMQIHIHHPFGWCIVTWIVGSFLRGFPYHDIPQQTYQYLLHIGFTPPFQGTVTTRMFTVHVFRDL